MTNDVREQLFESLIAMIEDWTWEIDSEFRYTYSSPQVRKLLGYDPKEIIEKTPFDLMHPENAAENVKEFGRLRKLSCTDPTSVTATITSLESKKVHKNGMVRIFETSGVPYFDEVGKFAGFRGFDRDITERKRIENAHQSIEDHKRSILDNLKEVMLYTDPNMDILWANRAACEWVNLAREELIGRKCYEVSAHRDTPCPDCIVKKAMETLEPCQVELEKPDGSYWLNTSHPVMDNEGKLLGCVDVSLDITDRKQAEEERRHLESQIQHTQKLESLGVLAGGIAHDFNNLLMAMLGNAGLAFRKLEHPSPVDDYLIDIENAAEQAAELCRQMLAYAGKGRIVVELLDISRIVEELGRMLEISISKKAQLRQKLPHDLPFISGDASQIHQVIMNLITNASDALEEKGGVISVTTGVKDCDQIDLGESLSEEPVAEGRYVFLEVSDNGSGMDEETKKRIFEPFFTTKFTGRGLGMASVLGIMRGHKGTITIDSELDRGTTATIFLPVAQAKTTSSRSEQRCDNATGAGAVVLLVDDDVHVRQTTRRMLEELDYRVLIARNGEEALEVYHREKDQIDGIILDLTMPKTSGLEMYRELRRIDQNVKVILSSGYNRKEAIKHFPDGGLAGFIQKPYGLEELRQALGVVTRNR